jgi:hypothetical protein
MDDAKCAKSSTDKLEPKRAKLLRDIAEPRCVKSRTDRENAEPRRDKPTNDIDEPLRKKFRNETAEPR